LIENLNMINMFSRLLVQYAALVSAIIALTARQQCAFDCGHRFEEELRRVREFLEAGIAG